MTFVDTNILLYAISTQPEEAVKTQKAKTILSDPNLTLSVQVLQEFYVQATRPTRPSQSLRHKPPNHSARATACSQAVNRASPLATRSYLD